MKLYHASPVENTESITAVGLMPTDCGTRIHGGEDTLQGKGHFGVYGFASIEDAVDFAQDNGSEYVIFSFVTDGLEIIADPEYDGNAWLAITDESITAEFEIEL